MKEGTFDVEQAVALKPDVLLMNIEAKVASDEAKLVEKLAEVGIPVVYVDFREKPFENTEPRCGSSAGCSARRASPRTSSRSGPAQIAAWRTGSPPRTRRKPKPLVMVDRAGGYSDDCCMSFGRENFGRMVEIAGGRNIGAEHDPRHVRRRSTPRQIIAAKPDHVIVTGRNWEAYVPGGAWVGVGPGGQGRGAAQARRR